MSDRGAWFPRCVRPLCVRAGRQRTLCTSACAAPPRTAAELPVSAEELKANRVDASYRDYCAHLLLPLNKCRHQTYYFPWKCEEERHSYEKCQYIE